MALRLSRSAASTFLTRVALTSISGVAALHDQCSDNFKSTKNPDDLHQVLSILGFSEQDALEVSFSRQQSQDYANQGFGDVFQH